jgi:hypothetical protein
LWIQSFNGKPQALPHFASACGSPLNENTQYLNSPASQRVAIVNNKRL